MANSESYVNKLTMDKPQPIAVSGYIVPWKRCRFCVQAPSSLLTGQTGGAWRGAVTTGGGGKGKDISEHKWTSMTFLSPREFCRHLRDAHCTREGGSFVCLYGPNSVCPSLPVEGVSDKDYEDHVARDHVAGEIGDDRDGESFLCAEKSSDKDTKSDVRASFERRPSRSVLPQSTDSSRFSTPELTMPPSVISDQLTWNVYMSKVNLPAALNDPRLARRETDFFSKTWGEGFERVEVTPSPWIPIITRDHFKKYLDQTSTRCKKHERCKSVTLNTTLPPTTATVKLRSDVEAIPKLFLQPGFSLENPETFNTVFPWNQIEALRHDQPHQSTKLLQEKLSHYLDIVEVQISKQVALRSDAFFNAMISHDELQEHLKSTCAIIKHLRKEVHHLSKILVEGPLKILSQTILRSNYIKVYEKLKLMATVHQTQPTIQLLLATNEFVGALDLIATTQEVLNQELAGIHSFKHLGSQLVELEKMIDRMMQDEFLHFASAHLNQPITHDPVSIDNDRLVMLVLGSLRQHRYSFIEIYSEEAVTAIKAIIKQTVIEAIVAADDLDTDNNVSLANQMRSLNYNQWMNLLKTLFSNLLIILNRVKTVVNIIHDIVEAVSESDPSSQPVVLAFSEKGVNQRIDTLRQDREPPEIEASNSIPVSISMGQDLAAENATEVTNGNQDNSIPAGQHTVTVQQSIKQLNSSDDVEVFLTRGEYLCVSGMLNEMMSQLTEQAHDRCHKVIQARGKDGFLERLSSSEFVQLSRSIEQFVDSSESISGHRTTSLRSSLQSQASKFVCRFHEERKQKLSLILDNERWKQADVPVDFQELVDHISTTGFLLHRIFSYSVNGKLCILNKKPEKDRKPQEYLYVDGQKFAVVGTVLMLLKMLVEYCQAVDDIPSAAPEILNRVVELLKMFNSRTCQLILGAGALQMVGLKTISTKNLGLASRCLQLVLRYIPIIRQHFELRLSPNKLTMLKHFDHLIKDYSDHITEISNKLVAIIDSMLESHLAMWEVKAPMPSPCFRAVVKQITKLHEVIKDLLPPQQLKELFQELHNSFTKILSLQLTRLAVTNDAGPQHGLVMADIAFYTAAIRALPELSLLELSIADIWERRPS